MSAKDLLRQDLEDIQCVAKTKSGARLIARLLTECDIYNAVYVENPMMLQFMTGKRSIGLILLSGLSLELQKMIREGEDERKLLLSVKENKKDEGKI